MKDLTPREEEVVDLVFAGRRQKQIARLLGIGERTVRCHITRIAKKLGLDGRPSHAIVHWKYGQLGFSS